MVAAGEVLLAGRLGNVNVIIVPNAMPISGMLRQELTAANLL
jgi:hypothetical protein